MISKTKKYRAKYWRVWKQKNRPDKIKICNVCNIEFKKLSNGQKRCHECRHIICLYCKKKFIPDNSTLNHKFCSRKCKSKIQVGFEPIHLQKNRGKKPRTYHLRKRDKHGGVFDREWREKIFKRDNFTCQFCGQRGGRLQADHIKPYKEFPELRHVLSNGRTLCIDCHKKTPTYGWSKYWHKRKKRLQQEYLKL